MKDILEGVLIAAQTKCDECDAEVDALVALIEKAPPYKPKAEELRERWSKKDEHGNKVFEIIGAADSDRRAELVASGAELLNKIGPTVAELEASNPEGAAIMKEFNKVFGENRPKLKEARRKQKVIHSVVRFISKYMPDE